MSKPFLLLFTARSGSTALYGNLNQHPDVMMHAEIFGAKQLPDRNAQTDDNRLGYLRSFWTPRRGLSRLIHRPQARGFKLQVNRLNAQFQNPVNFAQAARPFAPKVIVLRRENRLKQLISALNAERLWAEIADLSNGQGRAHVTPEMAQVIDKLKASPLTIDIDALALRLKGLNENYKALDAFAGQFPGALSITYEEYLADRDATVAKVLTFIGVDPRRVQITDSYLKITDDDMSAQIENYPELIDFVKGTEYEHMAT
jgi:LPS sulfotransferase NodH